MAVANVYNKVSFAMPREVAKLALPVVALVVALFVDGMFPDVYPQGYTSLYYPVFLRICTVVYLVLAVLSCWFARLRAHVIHFWGLLTAFFLLLTLYDWMTLKTGSSQLPYFPSADQIVSSYFKNAQVYWGHFTASIALMLQGLAVGVVAGLVYGTLMGYSRFFNYWLTPFIKLIGPVPSTAWMAVAMVLAPSSRVATIFLVALTVWFPLSVNLSGGIQGVERTYVERAQVMGASHFYILRHVIYPAALPSIFTGLFMGFCNSLTSLVTAEMLGVKAGLGLYLQVAEAWAEYDIIFSIVIVFIVVAFLMISILFAVQRRVMKWSKGAIQW